MKNPLLLVRHTCEDCGGSGSVHNPDWNKFGEADKAHKEKTGQFMTDREMRQFFEKLGYDGTPPDYYWCGECEGNGYLEQWKPAGDVLAELIKQSQLALR